MSGRPLDVPDAAPVASGRCDHLRAAMSRPRHIRHIASRRALAAGLGAGALLAAPTAARAADLAATGTCFASGQRLTVAGTAFTPGAPIAIGGGATGAAQADAVGAWTTEIAAPTVTELGPKTFTLTVVDGANAANTANMRIRVVREAFGSNLPIAGRPTERTAWRFAGFAPGRPIYGHFVLGGRSRGDYRFGVARGDCGTLHVRAPRIPGVRDVRPGRWTLKLDQHLSYRATTPGSAVTFRIQRRSGASGPDGGGSGTGEPGPG
jgi:hypothetical protein